MCFSASSVLSGICLRDLRVFYTSNVYNFSCWDVIHYFPPFSLHLPAKKSREQKKKTRKKTKPFEGGKMSNKKKTSKTTKHSLPAPQVLSSGLSIANRFPKTTWDLLEGAGRFFVFFGVFHGA